jgi:hypothetical protein
MAGIRDRRKRVGKVYIWDRSDEPGLGREQLHAFQEAPVTCVDMPTDSIGVSGGVDGVLHFWDVRAESSKPTTVSAHDGPVLAVECLSSQIVMTIGQDGRGRVWDLDRLECVQEFVDPGSGYTGGMLSLERVPHSRGVVGLYPSGAVLAHELDPGTANTYRVPVAGAGASALTLAGSHLVVAERQGQQIRSVPLAEAIHDRSGGGTGSLPGQATSTRKPLLHLEAVTTDHVIAASREENAVLWSVTPAPARDRELDAYDARTAAGPPRREQFSRGIARQREKRAELLDRVRDQLDSGRLSSLKPDLAALADEGMDVEAMVFLAEWARRNDRPLWELRVRLHLAEHLPEEPWCAVHYHALGQLLEQLQEPGQAQRYFERADQCQPGFREAADRANRLPARSKPPEGSVVDDFVETPGQAVAEAEKRAVLGEPWTYFLTVEREPVDGVPPDVSPEQVLRRLPDGEGWHSREKTVGVEGRTVTVPFLEIPMSKAGDHFVYAISFEEGQESQWIRRVWIAPPERTDGGQKRPRRSQDASDGDLVPSQQEKPTGLQTQVPQGSPTGAAPRIERHLQKIGSPPFREEKEALKAQLQRAQSKIQADREARENVLE